MKLQATDDKPKLLFVLTKTVELTLAKHLRPNPDLCSPSQEGWSSGLRRRVFDLEIPTESDHDIN